MGDGLGDRRTLGIDKQIDSAIIKFDSKTIYAAASDTTSNWYFLRNASDCVEWFAPGLRKSAGRCVFLPTQ